VVLVDDQDSAGSQGAVHGLQPGQGHFLVGRAGQPCPHVDAGHDHPVHGFVRKADVPAPSQHGPDAQVPVKVLHQVQGHRVDLDRKEAGVGADGLTKGGECRPAPGTDVRQILALQVTQVLLRQFDGGPGDGPAAHFVVSSPHQMPDPFPGLGILWMFSPSQGGQQWLRAQGSASGGPAFHPGHRRDPQRPGGLEGMRQVVQGGPVRWIALQSGVRDPGLQFRREQGQPQAHGITIRNLAADRAQAREEFLVAGEGLARLQSPGHLRLQYGQVLMPRFDGLRRKKRRARGRCGRGRIAGG